MLKRVNMALGGFLCASIVPQMLRGIERRTPRPLWQEAHVGKPRAWAAQMPSGAVHQQHNTLGGQLCSHLG